MCVWRHLQAALGSSDHCRTDLNVKVRSVRRIYCCYKWGGKKRSGISSRSKSCLSRVILPVIPDKSVGLAG